MNSRDIEVKLIIARNDFPVEEAARWLRDEDDALYVFPEGFVKRRDDFLKISEMIARRGKNVVLGWREECADAVYESVAVFENGRHVDQYRKTSLTSGEKNKGRRPGTEIRCVQMRQGRIGIPICYEIHFPEVVRIMALERPIMMINPIGTGMKNEHQLEEWITISRARAIENQVYVLGCSNFRGEIPLAYAINPMGDLISFARDRNDSLSVMVPLDYAPRYPYMEDRIPELYRPLTLRFLNT